METSSLNSGRERNSHKDARSSLAANRALEASCYALLQRLTPALQHKAAGAFQPVMMLTAALQRLVQAPAVDLDRLRTHCASMHEHSRSGATCSLDLFSWLAPTEHVEIGINDGIKECLGLVATELALREFTVINNLTMCTEIWPRNAIRSVFMASLLALSDAAASPAELVLSSESTAKGLALLLKVHSTNDATIREAIPIYRKIDWQDVEVLAEAEEVSLERTSNGVRLSLLQTAD